MNLKIDSWRVKPLEVGGVEEGNMIEVKIKDEPEEFVYPKDRFGSKEALLNEIALHIGIKKKKDKEKKDKKDQLEAELNA